MDSLTNLLYVILVAGFNNKDIKCNSFFIFTL